MASLTVEKICSLMNKSSNIRNFTVIGKPDQQKSGLMDNPMRKAGIHFDHGPVDPYKRYYKQERVDPRSIERSGCTSLYFKMSEDSIADVKQTTDGSEFLFNWIKTNDHADFSSEITTTLRIADGAFIIIDCVDGVCIQTEAVLHQVMRERVKPIIIISNLDRAILELKYSKEDLYKSFSRIIESVNLIISTYNSRDRGDLRVNPEAGTVIFYSGSNDWAFTTYSFAKRYSTKFGVDREKMVKKLWGEYYFDSVSKKWNTKGTDAEGKPLERAFNQFILDPIFRLFDTCLNKEKEDIVDLLKRLNITWDSDLEDFSRKHLANGAIRRFLPIEKALLKTIAIHLPSPITAQNYRVETLYEGPMDDESAKGIAACDPNGPLMVYISKMVPTHAKDYYYALGRVFSGTLRVDPNVNVRIQGPNHVHGTRNDLFTKPIKGAVIMMGRDFENIEECSAGNIIGLVGIDQFLLNSGTITTNEAAYNLKAMKLSRSPVVQVAVDCKDPANLPKLIAAFKRLARLDRCAQYSTSDTGEHMVAGSGESHLRSCLQELEELLEYLPVPITKSDPIVIYRETVKAESSVVVMKKSPNKHNRLFMKAAPIGEELTDAIDSGVFNPLTEYKARARILSDQYDWDNADARKIWSFGPHGNGPNILVDQTKGVAYVNEIKDACIAAFQWTTKEGVYAEEQMRGCRFNIIDVFLFTDVIHRGSGQIIPTCRFAMYASTMVADPGIMEPVYLAEITCSEVALGDVYRALIRHRGTVIGEEAPGLLTVIVKAYVPVSESFGLSSDLHGHAFLQYIFNHWESMPGTIDTNPDLETLVLDIRKRKGLKVEIPRLEAFLDRV